MHDDGVGPMAIADARRWRGAMAIADARPWRGAMAIADARRCRKGEAFAVIDNVVLSIGANASPLRITMMTMMTMTTMVTMTMATMTAVSYQGIAVGAGFEMCV